MACFDSLASIWHTTLKIIEIKHFACDGITSFDQGSSPRLMNFYELNGKKVTRSRVRKIKL